MDELHAVDHIYIHNFAVFSEMLNSQRYEILEAQVCTDPTASLDLQWKVSLFLHSTYHYYHWSLKMQAIHIGSYPGQRVVYLMPVINIGPWEMCILLTLIFEILQSSTKSCPFPYPDGVAIECLWSVDGVHYFHRLECTLRCHSNLMEWYWSGIGVA